MVFKSQNDEVRKCKWCDEPAKKNFSTGINKGYYRTCGSKICAKRQYEDQFICGLKGRLVKIVNYNCFCCGNKFKSETSNHTRFCRECCPDKSWRARAQRYRIGKKQWDDLLVKQNGTCALFDRNPETVYHCHIKGEVRGLLCGKCNMNLSRFEKDNEWLWKALNYLGVKYATI